MAEIQKEINSQIEGEIRTFKNMNHAGSLRKEKPHTRTIIEDPKRWTKVVNTPYATTMSSSSS